MKKLVYVSFVVALAVSGPVRAQNTTSTNTAPCAACSVKAPEPGLLLQLGLGLPAVGGLLILGRRRYLNRSRQSL